MPLVTYVFYCPEDFLPACRAELLLCYWFLGIVSCLNLQDLLARCLVLIAEHKKEKTDLTLKGKAWILHMVPMARGSKRPMHIGQSSGEKMGENATNQPLFFIDNY
jgi:hypothetical protein